MLIRELIFKKLFNLIYNTNLNVGFSSVKDRSRSNVYTNTRTRLSMLNMSSRPTHNIQSRFVREVDANICLSNIDKTYSFRNNGLFILAKFLKSDYLHLTMN